MSRVDDNIGILKALNDSDVSSKRYIGYVLADISKSLAMIADALSEKESGPHWDGYCTVKTDSTNMTDNKYGQKID